MAYPPQRRPVPARRHGRSHRILWLVLGGVLGLVLVIALVTMFLGDGSTATGDGAAGANGGGAADGGGGVPTVTGAGIAGARPAPESVTLTVRVTEKKCYGNGNGCAVSFRPVAEYAGPELSTEWTVTYEVTGVESGGGTGQFLLSPEGLPSTLKEWHVRTKGKSARITLRVTDVEPG
ncbi:hypothetical protein [Actinoplanes sp. NPDC051851]|uniref:hypothetical protein n=1 Tax=Actinoplanes sp. NPDC051851 TaxID=3154753 RepID=UPI00343ED7C3